MKIPIYKFDNIVAYAEVNCEDFEILNEYKWHMHIMQKRNQKNVQSV